MIEEDIPETHKCGQCSREFVTKQALQKHVSDHANEKRKEQQTEKKPTVPVQRNTVGIFFSNFGYHRNDVKKFLVLLKFTRAVISLS